MRRDLTDAQFRYRAAKLGFKPEGFLGYWRLASNPNISVSIWNAGKRRRDQLRYLIACDQREQQRAASEKGAVL
jgi:hypothetical protein